MSEYPKTENLYAASEDHRVRGPEYGYKAPGADQIAKWLVTEKVDGTNMRVVFESGSVNIFGRTDRAQIHPDLYRFMADTFTVEKMEAAFTTETGLPERVVIYGEGFGPGIQKAGTAYGGEKRCVIFDVRVNDWWLSWRNVCDIAEKLGVSTVPLLAADVDLEMAKALVSESRLLPKGSEHIEGIVCRTDPYLFDQHGRRVMFKYKVRDLAPALTQAA